MAALRVRQPQLPLWKTRSDAPHGAAAAPVPSGRDQDFRSAGSLAPSLVTHACHATVTMCRGQVGECAIPIPLGSRGYRFA